MSNENDFGDFDFVEQYGTTEEVVNEELLPENTAVAAINCGFIGVGGGGGRRRRRLRDDAWRRRGRRRRLGRR